MENLVLSILAGLALAIVGTAIAWAIHSFVILDFANPMTPIMRAIFAGLFVYGTVEAIDK